MTKVKTICFSIAFFLCYHISISQETIPIQNFSPGTYGAGTQNWSISQSKEKLIYIANNDGLLEFNGARWSLYQSPNESIMRSVKVIGDRIYTGCYMEFGFWEKTSSGELQYTPLSNNLDIELIDDEEFWNIIQVDDWVIFQSLNRICIFNPATNSIDQIYSEEDIVKMFEVNGLIYFQRKNVGIFQIINGEDTPLSEDNIFKTDEVVGIFPYGKAILILTRHNGFFAFANNIIEKVPSFLDIPSDMSIYNSLKLRNGNYALGTISNGVVLLDENLNRIIATNQRFGLQKNTVLSIFEDIDLNLWVGLDYGVSYLNINSPLRIFVDELGVLGSVYTSALHNEKLYLGTNQGLFFKNINEDSGFELVRGSQGQVWHLTVIGDDLFCGHHNGTFIVKNSEFLIVSNIPGAWNIKKLDNQRIIQGNYDGLYILDKTGTEWTVRNKIDGFDNSSRSFEVSDQTILVNHEYEGIFQIEVDSDFNHVKQINFDSLLRGSNSSITKYNNKIYYAYRLGVFQYDENTKGFERDSILSSIYTEDEYLSGKLVKSNDEAYLWGFSKNHLIRVSESNFANVPKIDRIPLTYNTRRNVIEYENILAIDGQNKYLVGTSFGYIIFDADKISFNDFNVYLNGVSVGINADHSASNKLIDISEDGVFESSDNNVRISFHTPQYLKYFNPSYQFQLEGIYDVWSEWTTESTVFYENLPPGNYSFNVKAKIGNKESQNIASYVFTVARPWYRTNLMITIYVVTAIIILIFMHGAYRSYYRRQREELVEYNKKRLEILRLQNEQEIIKLKNQQLEEDYKNKSNELAASTMSMIKKNELLTHIKERLTLVNDIIDVKPVIKTINQSLNHNQNWEMFKETFENIDTEFFKSLKTLHPNLSPNDLKVCAYLRLNLTSKEIAQLINISPKSVEVKRYRLRKKLNLDSNENLIDYILSI